MNERIKELAKQSGLLATTLGPTVETHHMKKKEQDLEKFAELVVAAVISKAEDCGLGCDAVEQLKKDFGVTE